MSWSQRTLTWPPSAASIETAAGSVLAGLPAIQQQAISALNSAAGAVGFKPHALSTEAAGLLHLRDQLNQLLVSGQRITVTPYDYDVAGMKIAVIIWPRATPPRAWPTSCRTAPTRTAPRGSCKCWACW